MRGWILRKNYTNLREAAKVLQLAWRERKHKSGASQELSLNTLNSIAVAVAAEEKKNQLRSSSNSGSGGSSTMESVGNAQAIRQKVRRLSAERQQIHNNTTTTTTINTNTSTTGRSMSTTVSAVPNSTQLLAAATLQAATRGMLARRSFASVRRQTMASLVIQKGLLHWYTQKGNTSIAGSNSGNGRLGSKRMRESGTSNGGSTSSSAAVPSSHTSTGV